MDMKYEMVMNIYERMIFYHLCPLEEGNQMEYDGKKLNRFETMDKFHARYHEDKRNRLSYMKQSFATFGQKPICRKKRFDILEVDGDHLEKQLPDKLVAFVNFKDNYFKIFRNENDMENDEPLFKFKNNGKRQIYSRDTISSILECTCKHTGKLNMLIELVFNYNCNQSNKS